MVECLAEESRNMQRYFVKNSQIHDGIVDMDPIMHKHIAKVMRMKQGEKVIVTDESGQFFLATVFDLEGGRLILEKALDENNELDVDVTLVYGMPKGDKFEFVLQKATELGVTKIVPFLCARSLIKMDESKFMKKKPRYERIIQEASEQSHRNICPEVTAPIHLKELKDYLSEVNVVAYEESAKQGEVSAFHRALEKLTTSITIIVGPEGGFDESEITAMKDLGITPVGLGKRILRSESAPLYMLSVIGYERELA